MGDSSNSSTLSGGLDCDDNKYEINYTCISNHLYLAYTDIHDLNSRQFRAIIDYDIIYNLSIHGYEEASIRTLQSLLDELSSITLHLKYLSEDMSLDTHTRVSIIDRDSRRQRLLQDMINWKNNNPNVLYSPNTIDDTLGCMTTIKYTYKRTDDPTDTSYNTTQTTS